MPSYILQIDTMLLNSRPHLNWQFFGEKFRHFFKISTRFLGRDSAEASAEASVKVAEASVSAESRFRPIRSFTITFLTYKTHQKTIYP